MLVVGGGPGGYTAALYAARAGLDTVVLEKLSAGGQMALTEQIDNYPGFEDGIDGFSLAEKMQKQAERFGVRSEYAEVLRMDLTAVPKLVETSEGIFRGKPWCWPPVGGEKVDCDGVFVSVGRQPPRRWRRVSYRWTRAAISWPERPRRPAFPAFTPWATDKASPSGGHRRGTARWQSTWRRNISEVSDTKKEFKKLLRPAVPWGWRGPLWAAPPKSITASPVNTILYMGLMGWLLSGIFGSQSA